MMASKQLLGKISEFNKEVETFENYIERLDSFFSVNKIHDDNKLSLFIAVMGPELYSVLKNLLVPSKPADKTYTELVDVLKAHYAPRKNLTYERFVFNKRTQREGETIAEFAVQLKKLASTCEFKDFLDDALRDKFLCGLRSNEIQGKLLSEGSSLDFKKALEIALVMEDANRSVRQLHHQCYGDRSVSYVDNEINAVKFGGRKVSYNQNKCKPNAGWESNNSGNFGKFQDKPNQNNKQCFRCGKGHYANNCPYKNYRCNKCNKVGHLAAVCRQNSTGRPKGKINLCDGEIDHEVTDGDDKFELYTIALADDGPKPKSFTTELIVNEVPIKMIIDTGAVVSIMPDNVFLDTFGSVKPKLVKSKINLKTYTGQEIKIVGEFQARVRTDDGVHELPMIVVQSNVPNQPTLLGRNWLRVVKIDWSKIKQNSQMDCATLIGDNGKNVSITSSINELKTKYAPVFENKIGTIKDVKVDLVIKENSKPVFCRARNVPYALKGAVESELQKLVDDNVIYPVTKSEWATPIVVVPKPNNGIRICGDYKTTVNPCLRTDYYPLPTPDEIFSNISGSEIFTKLDLSAAYNQICVSESSQELLTINTCKGLFRYKRLPFGITSAGAIFQSTMDRIFAGLKNVHCYLDDILITARTFPEMYKNIDLVLSRLMQYGVKVNGRKSEFFKSSLTFLGHRLDSQGIHPSEELTETITKTPEPRNVSQLRSYLGMLNYYGKFLPNLSTLLHPLYHLLNKGSKWVWTSQCDDAFKKSKNLLLQNTVLIPFDPKLDIVVTADASPYGVGAVIAHRMPDDSERPIAFASRTLTASEVKYSQLEKEALALIFAVKKFHVFLYGKRFLLATDHRPLTFLLGPNKGIPTLAAARIQRWAIILSAYEYDLVYRKGTDVSNADALSRLPNKDEPVDSDDDISFFSATLELPITHKEISVATRHDPVLSKVLDYTLNGWPNHNDQDRLKPYFSRSTELSVDKDCILWGRRVIIPEPYRKEILQLLHMEHPGISRIKNLARSYVWWPSLDQDLEDLVKTCTICQSTRNSIPLAPLQHWSWPKNPWQRLHIDFANFRNQDFLIIVDSHTKWLEVFHMSSTTSAKTIEKLRTCFAAFGLPCTVVSDGGPQFTSKEFNDFLKSNGINHVVSPPYHPSSNGLAERAVQTTKNTFLKQMLQDEKSGSNRSLQHRIDNFLFVYRNTPHSTTGNTPADMLLGFKPRNRLTLLKPHLSNSISSKYEKIEKKANMRRGPFRSFSVGENVFVKSVRQEHLKWLPGIITEVISPMTYTVKVEGRERFVHADHLRPNQCIPEDDNLVIPDLKSISPMKTPIQSPLKSPGRPTATTNVTNQEDQNTKLQSQEGENQSLTKPKSPNVTLRRSRRERRTPNVLNL